MSEAQHGFVANRSCTSNLATLLSTAWISISEGLQTDCVYTDYTAAFQSVNHSLLVHKLQNYFNVTGSALHWFKSYLGDHGDRQQRVVVNGKCTVKSGTPEGGLLSLLLFAMYVNDLPDQIDSKCLMFVDDVKLYRKISSPADSEHLQRDIHTLTEWSKNWKLTLNPTKCKSFRMTHKKQPIQCTYFIENTPLEHVTVIWDLGVILDEKLTFGPHVDMTVKKANRALGMLFRSFQTLKSHGQFNKTAILAAYYAHVRSILEYCCTFLERSGKSSLRAHRKNSAQICNVA